MVIDCLGFLLIFILTLSFAYPLGRYLCYVYTQNTQPASWLSIIEKRIYRLAGIDPSQPMNWKQYLKALLLIQPVWFIPAFLLLMLQGKLILNPAGITGMDWSLAFNTAVSFLTSTNLQHYSGETGASYFSQIGVLTFLQFLSAAVSLCAGVAIVRGLSSADGENVGNFYSDLVRSITRVLLPLSIVVATLFMLCGMPMNFKAPHKLITLQGDTVTVARGPIAAMIPIKELGSNGGGFYGANDAHPFENPNFFSFILHLIIVWLLPMAFIFFVGRYMNQRKFAWMVFGVMSLGVLLLTIPIVRDESLGNPRISALGIRNDKGNMEGKEIRFGTNYSAFYAAENVAIPAGTVASVHDSYMPLSSIAMLIGMQVDAFFGGLGTGFINMLIYLIIAVFIATLMIGRSPELFGKKIGIQEMQVATLVMIAQVFVPVVMAATACFTYTHWSGGGGQLGWLSNKGPHGFTTMLYEYITSVAGNGSNFGGLGNNTAYWNLTTAFAMLTGRYVPIIGGLVIAGLVRKKKFIPASLGTLQIDTVTFGTFLFAIIIILTVLSLFVMLMAGPITEHFLLR